MNAADAPAAPPGRSTYATASWVFLRGLGVVYLIAFASLWVQIDGLIGSKGILPAQEFLTAVGGHFGAQRYWVVPTLCWFDCSDAFLRGICALGAVCSFAIVLDVAPVAALFGSWVAYLSLVSIGQDFLSFQWDALLLEAGWLAIFLAPLHLWPNSHDPPPRYLAVWLLQWLLFRLMFSSGLVKLASGDATWRNLTALLYHYETQPLPTWIGWYAHQLPAWFQQLSCGLLLIIELAVPWLIFGPKLARRMACAALVGLQLIIAATGNYCFFNLLTVLLCLLLLDDPVWPAAWRRQRAIEAPTTTARRWPAWLLVALAVLVVPVSLVEIGGRWIVRGRWMVPLVMAEQGISPFRLVNGYGLFAVMTTERSEIVIEGSRDGHTWQPYEFTDKPGELRRPPRFVAPHQPRLDWQMWFAALSSYRQSPWFLQYCRRLLEGSPAVLALLSHNPFPESPPRYLRAVVYDYHFTTPAGRRTEGAWWRRAYKGLYCPVLSLKSR